MLTDRAVLFYWDDVNVHDIFCPPPGLPSWDYQLWRKAFLDSGTHRATSPPPSPSSSSPMSSPPSPPPSKWGWGGGREEGEEEEEGYVWWLPSVLCWRDWCAFPPNSEENGVGSVFHLVVEGKSGEGGEDGVYASLGGCGGGNKGSGGPEWGGRGAQHVFLEANQYFVPLLWANPKFRAKLESWFPTGEVARVLLPYLFHPVDPVVAAVDAFVDAEFVAGNTVGFQIRSAPAYLCIENAFDSREDAAAVITTNMLACLPGVEGVEDAGSAKVFVASMHKEAKARVRETLGENNVVLYNGLADVSDDLTVGDTRDALIDILLLSRTDVMLASPLSTFAYVASALAGRNPVAVSIPLPPPFADESLASPCVPLGPVGLEPCFHANSAFSKQVPMPQCLEGGLPASYDRPRSQC